MAITDGWLLLATSVHTVACVVEAKPATALVAVTSEDSDHVDTSQ